MATTHYTENVFLRGPEDWENWSAQFKTRAISTNIWGLITPRTGREITDPEREEPTPPNTTDYDKRLTRETGSQSSQSSGTVQGSQQPMIEEVDHANRPRKTAEMTTAARQSFQLDWTIYQHEFKIYTAEREAIDMLKN